jgi:TRAP-type C4-dicarboxylate transport system substrate-binding protein
MIAKLVAGLFIHGLFTLGLLAGAGSAAAQTREFRLSTVTPPTHPLNLALAEADRALRARSNGRLAIRVFANGQLGSEAAALRGLQDGSLDMAWIFTSELANALPAFGALHAPFLVRDMAQAARLLETPAAQALLERLPEIGVVGFGFAMGSGLRQIGTREPAASVADLKGERVRIVPSTPVSDFYAQLGMTPAVMPFRDIYGALATGAVDAIDMGFDSIADYKLHDHLQTLLLTNHALAATAALMSASVWATLPAADQALIRAVMQDQLAAARRTMVAQDRDFLAQLRRSHLTLVEIDRAALAPATAAWDRQWRDKAPLLPALRAAADKL